MLEIKNKNKFPMQLMIRTRKVARGFTVLNVPGIGSGKNIFYLEDERATEYIYKAEKDGLIITRQLPNKPRKGE